MRVSLRPLAALVGAGMVIALAWTSWAPAPWAGAAATSRAVVTGVVRVSGLPARTQARSGLEACPASTPKGYQCPHPHLDTVRVGTPYRLVLPAGSWRLTPYYSLLPYGGLFIKGGPTRSLARSSLTRLRFTIRYSPPGTVQGSLAITAVPPGIDVNRYSLVACPSSVGFRGRAKPSCVEEFSGASGGPGVLPAITPRPAPAASGALADSATYRITTLPPGKWTLYPGYSTIFGSPVSLRGTRVRVTARATTTTNLSTPFLPPTHGAIQGVAFIANAPGTFVGAVGMAACPASSTPLTSCTAFAFTDDVGRFHLALKPGSWWLRAYYVDFRGNGGPVVGPPTSIQVSAGVITSQNLTVPYS